MFWLARTTVFAAAIFVVGSVLCFHAKLSGAEWIAMIGIVQGLVVLRAVASDYHDRQTSQNPATIREDNINVTTGAQ